jgi:23S rRNA (cytosine1962-C5)-methyltransferase
MLDSGQYQLLDFGQGRRLERFGEFVLDRPCPAVERVKKAEPKLWDNANACFAEGGEKEGRWFFPRKGLPEQWTIGFDNLRFELKLTPQGQVGIFPEQAENWEWIGKRGEERGEREESSRLPASQGMEKNSENAIHSSHSPHPLPLSQRERGETTTDSQRERGETIKVLNLFAYTGGSTLAAAAAGMEVTHVDAAKNIVEWARRNAELSGMAEAPIRWICEDAWKFVKREIKRGNRYDAVILDPPSYGHGPKGEVWQLAKHLPMLLAQCAELTAGQCEFVLLTCHTPGYDADRLSDMLKGCFPLDSANSIDAKPLSIRSADGREMSSGTVVRCRTGFQPVM